MSGAREPEFISLKAQACSKAFNKCNGKSQSFCTADLQDQCGRFNVWASTTGVFAHPHASLDFRLRETPEIRAMITRMITVIIQSIQSVEKLSNTHAKPPRSIDTTAPLDDSTTKEIAQNIISISNDIGLLYRLSHTIQQASAEEVYREAVAEPRLTDKFSERFKTAAHRFLTWEFRISSEGLRERLASAMLIRRNRFYYLQERYGDKSEMYPDATQLDQNNFCRSSKTRLSSELQFFFPPPPKACNNTKAKCPYCLITLPATDLKGEKWNEHVIADLDPYVCLYEGCDLPPERMLFERSQDWIDHMRQSHLLKWCCKTKDHKETFDTESDFTAHLQKFHVGDFEEEDLPLLAKLSVQPIGRTFEICPFCGAENMIDADLESHISDHLIALALLSLPAGGGSEKDRRESCTSVETHSSTGKPMPLHRSTADEAHVESPRQSQRKERSISTPSIDKIDPDLASEPVVQLRRWSDFFASLDRPYERERYLDSDTCVSDKTPLKPIPAVPGSARGYPGSDLVIKPLKVRWPPSQAQQQDQAQILGQTDQLVEAYNIDANVAINTRKTLHPLLVKPCRNDDAFPVASNPEVSPDLEDRCGGSGKFIPVFSDDRDPSSESALFDGGPVKSV